MPFDEFGEEYRLLVDTSHTSGGAWGVATYEELGGAPTIDRDPGIISAEFPDRSKKTIGHRRSKKRNPQLDFEAFVRPGDAAYDRFHEAAYDETNDGTEILRVMVVEGDPEEAGNVTWEADFVVTALGAPSSGFGDGASQKFTLRHAADSPNDPVKGVTS